MDAPTKERLISEVKSRPELWDKKHKARNNQPLINNLWDEVAYLLNATRDDVKKQWRYMVDQYRVHFNNIYKDVPLGAELEDVQEKIESIRWPFFKQMLFLVDITKRKRPATKKLSADGNDELFCTVDVMDIRVQPTEEPTYPSEMSSTLSETSALKGTQWIQPAEPNSTEKMEEEEESLIMPVAKPKKRKHTSDDLAEHLISELKSVNEEIERGRDANVRFGMFVADLLGKVPEHLRLKCQRMVTNIIFDFQEGKIPTVIQQPF